MPNPNKRMSPARVKGERGWVELAYWPGNIRWWEKMMEKSKSSRPWSTRRPRTHESPGKRRSRGFFIFYFRRSRVRTDCQALEAKDAETGTRARNVKPDLLRAPCVAPLSSLGGDRRGQSSRRPPFCFAVGIHTHETNSRWGNQNEREGYDLVTIQQHVLETTNGKNGRIGKEEEEEAKNSHPRMREVLLQSPNRHTDPAPDSPVRSLATERVYKERHPPNSTHTSPSPPPGSQSQQTVAISTSTMKFVSFVVFSISIH